ncbi:hypothetical protein [Mycolicibacterium mucogenicum]|uniref:Uncharacterized protein n=1 Tax=Mycolicibacterium mucogenicum TaxID=56689 RepID=A0A4R5W860_MYCMU|nr:hypothetical protein [Mycolicibacterium mucogenicum]TDK84753.1 hypothetical protein EUA03_24875 [Mycolicibacterium mucogenicum]
MSTINQQPVPDEKRLCTGDVWCGCTCHACTVTFEHCVTPTPAVSDKLGTELLFDGLANLLTMAREDLSDLFEALPADAPLWVVVDLTAARAHLLAAVKKLDSAADRLDQAVAK